MIEQEKINLTIEIINTTRKYKDYFKSLPIEYRNNKDIVLSAIKKNPDLFEFASNDLKNDKGIALIVLNKDPSLFKFVSAELKNDIEIISIAAFYNAENLISTSDELRDNKSFVLSILTKQKSSKPNFSFSINFEDYSLVLKSLSNRLRDDKDIALAAIKKTPSSLKYVSDRLKNNKDVVSLAAFHNIENLTFASNELKNDKYFIISTLTKEKPKSIFSLNFKNYALVFKSLSNELKADKDVALIFIDKNPLSLKYASDTLKNDKDIVLSAVVKNTSLIEFASNDLKKDKAFIISLFNSFKLTPDFGFKGFSSILKNLSDNLKNDKDIVLASVNKNISSFKYASDELRNDKLFVLDLMNIDSSIIKHASLELQQDKDVLDKSSKSKKVTRIDIIPDIHISDKNNHLDMFLSLFEKFKNLKKPKNKPRNN